MSIDRDSHVETEPSARSTDRRTELFIKIGFGIVAVSQFPIGIWGVFDPMGFYENFPGLGMHWVRDYGPYSHHLVIDAASGFLAIGVLATLGIFITVPVARQVALAGCLAALLPHFFFHFIHPAAAMDTLERIESTGGMALDCAICLVLLAVITVRQRRVEGVAPAR